MFRNLTSNVLVKKITIDGTNYTLAAGTSDVNSEVVDTRGYEACVFLCDVGVMAASSTVDFQVQQGAVSDGSDAADLAGSNATQVGASDDDKPVLITIVRPAKRYLRVQTIRGDGGNSTINAMYALLSNPTHGEVTVDSRVISDEIFVTPAEGTA